MRDAISSLVVVYALWMAACTSSTPANHQVLHELWRKLNLQHLCLAFLWADAAMVTTCRESPAPGAPLHWLPTWIELMSSGLRCVASAIFRLMFCRQANNTWDVKVCACMHDQHEGLWT